MSMVRRSRKGYSYRKGPQKHKAWWANPKSYADIANTAVMAYRSALYLKSIINVEIKKFDTLLTSTALTDAGFVQNMALIAQGDTAGLRDGNSIKTQWFTIQGHFEIHASAVNTSVRMIVFLDNQTVADTTPTVGTVLDGDVVSFTYAPLNSDTVGRFTKLYDKVIVLDVVKAPRRTFKVNLKLKKHLRFNGTAGTDIQKNGIFVLFVADEVTNDPTMEWFARLGYTDN